MLTKVELCRQRAITLSINCHENPSTYNGVVISQGHADITKLTDDFRIFSDAFEGHECIVSSCYGNLFCT
jgi:hypothetical protein